MSHGWLDNLLHMDLPKRQMRSNCQKKKNFLSDARPLCPCDVLLQLLVTSNANADNKSSEKISSKQRYSESSSPADISPPQSHGWGNLPAAHVVSGNVAAFILMIYGNLPQCLKNCQSNLLIDFSFVFTHDARMFMDWSALVRGA